MIVLWGLAGGVAELVNVLLRKGSIQLINSGKPGRSVFIVIAGFVIRIVWTGMLFRVTGRALRHRWLPGLLGFWFKRPRLCRN